MTRKTTFKSTLFVYIHKNIKLFKFTKILTSKNQTAAEWLWLVMIKEFFSPVLINEKNNSLLQD